MKESMHNSNFAIAEAFAATGWRVGYLIGPEHLMTPTLAATTRIVFCSNSPLQEAVAAGLEEAGPRGYFEQQCKEYEERRSVLIGAFDRLGVSYTLPEGSYFVLLVRRGQSGMGQTSSPKCLQDISNLKWPDDYPFPKSLDGRGRDFK